jgi:protein-disulfide isomerase
MASGKKSREARRAAAAKPPPVQSKGGTRARQASPKVLGGIAGVVILIVIAVVLAVVVFGGNKSSAPKNVPTVGSIPNGLPGSAEVAAMFHGIPQKNLVLGSAFAPVTMTEYIDLQCPICQEFETTVMPNIIPKYVRTGKVKVYVRPWAFIGADSFRGQSAMIAAGLQNKAFNYAQILYDNQGTENTGWLDSNMVVQAASGIPGLKVPQLLADSKSSTVKNEAKAVATEANARQVAGTPTIFVGKSGTKGTQVNLQSGGDEQSLVTALDAALGQ